MASLAVFPKRKHEFSGRYPQLSCNRDGWVVMVFNTGTKMYSIAGKIERDNIQWAQGGETPQFIANGHYPKVAINDSNVVVEVHKSQVWNTLWYRVGTLDVHNSEINWSEDDHLLRNAGTNPAVALSNDGIVIIAHQQADKTCYCVGRVNTDATEISWQGSADGSLFGITTKEPSITMNEKGLVVVAAEGHNNIVFCVGTLDKSNYNIMWNEIDQVASKNMQGCSPVVAINEENHIISVHMSNILRTLFVKYGAVKADTKRIKWSEDDKPFEYDSGLYPAITLNSRGQVVRMREFNGSFGMYYEVGNLSSS